MMPIGPLMIEHRLIERMIKVMTREIHRMENERKANPVLIEAVVDFIQTYADRCHHGKEEDILFRDLGTKSLSEDHKRIMNELIDEHRWGRRTTGRLVEANEGYERGDEGAIDAILACMRALVDFYPKHIEKEDKHFFIPIMDYFSQAEKDTMLNEEYEFDRNFVHQKYQEIVTNSEKLVGP